MEETKESYICSFLFFSCAHIGHTGMKKEPKEKKRWSRELIFFFFVVPVSVLVGSVALV